MMNFEHQDWLGTERARTTSSGVVEGTYSTLPFGDGMTANGSDNNLSHFAGTDADLGAASNLDHATFREYGATAGRWMSPDPYSGSYDPGDPQSLNRYSYTSNSPLSATDPSGLMTISSCVEYGICGGSGGGSRGGSTYTVGGGYNFGSGWDEFDSFVSINTSEEGTVYSSASNWENAVNEDTYNTASGGTIYSQNGEASGTYSTTFFGLLGAGSFSSGTSGLGSSSISSAPSKPASTPKPLDPRPPCTLVGIQAVGRTIISTLDPRISFSTFAGAFTTGSDLVYKGAATMGKLERVAPVGIFLGFLANDVHEAITAASTPCRGIGE